MISKEAQERKNEILDAADKLFKTKGFDKTTISDILQQVGIARGTLYYHFKSKEEIMDSIIHRHSGEMLSRARKIAQDQSIPLLERFFLTIQALNMNQDDEIGMIDFIHRPQNALINERNQKVIVEEVPPILVGVVEEGITEGVFSLEYPYETIEMILIYANTIFGNEFPLLPEDVKLEKIKAFICNMEVLFGAEKGTFDQVMQLVLGRN